MRRVFSPVHMIGHCFIQSVAQFNDQRPAKSVHSRWPVKCNQHVFALFLVKPMFVHGHDEVNLLMLIDLVN
jgi:hypothetical protein